MSPFKSGQSGNPNGRPKQSYNKLSTEMRQDIITWLRTTYPKIKKDFDKIEPKDRIRLFLSLLEYVIPKIKSTEDPLLGPLSEKDLNRIIEQIKAQEHEKITYR